MKKIAYKLILLLRDIRIMDALLWEQTDQYIYIQDSDEWIRLFCDDYGMRSAILTEENCIGEKNKINAYVLRDNILFNNDNEEFDCFYRYVSSCERELNFIVYKFRIEYKNDEFILKEKFVYSIGFDVKSNKMSSVFSNCYKDFYDFLEHHEADFTLLNPRVNTLSATRTTTQLFFETMEVLNNKKKFLSKFHFYQFFKHKEGIFVNRLYGNQYLFDFVLYYLLIVTKMPNKTTEERRANIQLAEEVLITNRYRSFADFARTCLDLN